MYSRMLIVIFGASLLTSAMSIIHSVSLIVISAASLKFNLIVPIAAEVEVYTFNFESRHTYLTYF